MSVSAILLAAGMSTRMQPLSHKAFIHWQGKTLLEHQITALQQSSVSEIIIVVGYNAHLFTQITNKYEVITIYNENYKTGKCSSIIKGLHSINKSSNYILIAAIDQPVESAIINKLIQSLQNSNSLIAMPVYKEKRGHPILLSTKIYSDLLTIKEDTFGIRNIIQKYENHILEVSTNNPVISLNINTPENYLNAIKILK